MPPKKTGKGKGGKGHKRAKNGASAEAQVKELVLRQEGQAYGKVCKMLGNGRVSCKVFLETGEKTLMCIIPGKFRKRLWINMEDLVLVGIRDYQEDKLDILYKYSAVEAKRLIKLGEVPLTESDINEENDQINDNIQWVTDQKEEKPEPVQKKKNVTINGNASYINEDFLPPTGSDDESKPKKSLINGQLNQKGKSLEGTDSQQEEASPNEDESSEEDESESESDAEQEKESDKEPEKKWTNNLKSVKIIKNVKKGEEAKVEINLDDL